MQLCCLIMPAHALPAVQHGSREQESYQELVHEDGKRPRRQPEPWRDRARIPAPVTGKAQVGFCSSKTCKEQAATLTVFSSHSHDLGALQHGLGTTQNQQLLLPSLVANQSLAAWPCTFLHTAIVCYAAARG